MKQFLGIFLASFLFGCIPMTTATTTSPEVVYAQPARTGVYLNGAELSPAQKAELDVLVGQSVPPGHYYVDAYGQLAAGEPAGAQAGAHSEVFSSGPGGTSSMTSVGDCIMVSTPDVDFAGSGC